MHSTFPKRDYTMEDMNLSLKELHLAPSACILIIPSKSVASKAFSNILPTSVPSASAGASGVQSSSIVSYANDFLSILFLPVTIIWSLVTGLLGYNTASNTSSNNQNPSRPSQTIQSGTSSK